jgi:pimeloyl-ACP methyl ester carboxylesterase
MLSAMNAQSGSARAFARTVRDIVGWRGQRHTFFKHANELSQLPSIAVFWGNRDAIIPASDARAFADYVDGIRMVLFEGCGHYPQHEQPAPFLSALRDFLDDPVAPKAHLRDRGSRLPLNRRPCRRSA